jgi:hypothetical protein
MFLGYCSANHNGWLDFDGPIRKRGSKRNGPERIFSAVSGAYPARRLPATADFPPRLMRLAACLLICVLTALSARPVWAQSDDPVQDAVAGTIKKLDLQLTLPHMPTQQDQGSSLKIGVPQEVIWLVAFVVAGILLYVLLDMIPGWRSRTDEGWETGGDFTAGLPTPGATLAEADELARQNLFVEAMHLLLLYSLAEIRRRLKLEFSDSLTSREILRRAQLPENATAALRGIVTRVELSYFGDHPATRPDYESCRARYEELSLILAGPAANPAPGIAR